MRLFCGRSLDWVAQMLNLGPDVVKQALVPVSNAFLIAHADAGRLITIAAPAIILKSGEVAHLEVEANLMKEVVHRETRGGYSAYSFRIMKGVSYRTGSYRGKSVITGTSMEVADEGTLTITSQRAVFKGLRQSVESLYSKLVGVNVFDNGIQFQVSKAATHRARRGSAGFPRTSRAAWQSAVRPKPVRVSVA